MNLYFDSSALVKLYVDEVHSDRVWALVAEHDALWSSLVAYAEVRSAFGRRRRDGSLKATDFARVLNDFNGDWSDVNRVVLDHDLALAAGELADRHRLRGFDAIHLASAVRVRDNEGGAIFLSFDNALQRAAASEGLTLED